MDKYELGRLGEEYASHYLVNNGYRIISRNQQFNSNSKKLGEIDIIATKDNITYIFEVKTRNSKQFGQANQSITKTKLQTLYTITELLANKYQTIQIQLIAIDVNKNQFALKIYDLY